MTPRLVLAIAILSASLGPPHADAQMRTREAWLTLARSGFAVPPGDTAAGLLVDMNALLASPDPVLRDEVAYSAAATWIVSKRLVGADDLRRLITL